MLILLGGRERITMKMTLKLVVKLSGVIGQKCTKVNYCGSALDHPPASCVVSLICFAILILLGIMND